MTTLATACLILLLACTLVCVYRLWIGPGVLDRLLAYDLTGTLVSLSLAIWGLLQDSWVYLEVSMALAVLAFVSTMAAANYIERGRIF